MTKQEIKSILVYLPFGTVAAAIMFAGMILELGRSQEEVTVSAVIAVFAVLLPVILVIDPDVVGRTGKYRESWERYSYKKVMNVGLGMIALAIGVSVFGMMACGSSVGFG